MIASADRAARIQADPPGVAAWLARHGLAATSVEPLAGDVSTRSYFRVALEGEQKTFVVAHYPAELAAAQLRFVRAAALLSAVGVRVPSVRIDDPDAGCALLEDLGAATVRERFDSWEQAPRELDGALAAAAAIERLDLDAVTALGNPPLDAALLRRELAQTVDCLLVSRGLAQTELERAFDELCESLTRRPLVACHRDYMARNLVPCERHGVAVLDFQDLRLGPVGYDLASLLNDSLFASPQIEARCLSEFPRLGGDAEQYRLAVVQRSLKAVGTYLAFARRGMRRHLPLVEPTLERALRLFATVPGTRTLAPGWSDRLRAAGRDAALC